MFKNYILIAWRASVKDKGYAVLNIAGLTIGIACAMTIFLYVQDELTYDGHHLNGKNIYRLNAAYHLPENGGVEEWAASGSAIGEILHSDFPEVNQTVRIRKLTDWVVEKPSSDERFYETFAAADSNIFKVFTFPFINGNPEDALTDLHTVVISKRMAEKYFNKVDIVGESIRLVHDSTDLKITGVFENYPGNTHLKLDFIISMETHRSLHKVNLQNWWNFSFHTYLDIVPGVDIKNLEHKIKHISRKYIPDQEDNSGYRQEYALIPLSRIHLYSNLRSEMEANSKASYVHIFLIIGIFILIIACVNFMNLATARASKRAKEIGLRKVAGAARFQLVGQFLGEAFVMTLISMIFAIIVCVVSIPQMNDITGKQLSIFANFKFWTILGVVSLFVALLAGSYPSFFLSAFKPVETLKGSFKNSSKGNVLRKTLVVFQFSISIFLIAGTLVIFNHINYLRSINLGFDKEKMIFIPTHGVSNAGNDFKILKEELKKISGVQAVTLSSRVPGKEMANNVVRLGWDDNAPWSDMRYLTIDYDFIETYKLKIAAGRGFSENYPSDEAQAFLLNESGMRRLGWKNPQEAIGQKLWWQNRKGEIIGIVKDFHFMSANAAIEPFLIAMNTPNVLYLSAKIASGNPKLTVNQFENVFRSLFPEKVFEYQFLDQDFDHQYKTEEKFMKVFTFFSVVAIIIAALGLYGLAMFMTELKLKELGIRKVLGASENSLVYLLTKNFLNLVAISFIIAIPAAYWTMNKWLESFPVREQINLWLLIFAGAMAFIIAILTVSYQSVKAARANPVNSILGNN